MNKGEEKSAGRERERDSERGRSERAEKGEDHS